MHLYPVGLKRIFYEQFEQHNVNMWMLYRWSSTSGGSISTPKTCCYS